MRCMPVAMLARPLFEPRSSCGRGSIDLVQIFFEAFEYLATGFLGAVFLIHCVTFSYGRSYRAWQG